MNRDVQTLTNVRAACGSRGSYPFNGFSVTVRGLIATRWTALVMSRRGYDEKF